MRTKESYTDNLKTVYTYDDDNLHVRTTDYDENGKVSCDIQYHHNCQNQCDGWRVFDSNGVVIYWFEVAFDEFGREKEVLQFNKENTLELRTISNYDENGFLTSETIFDGNGNEIESEDF